MIIIKGIQLVFTLSSYPQREPDLYHQYLFHSTHIFQYESHPEAVQRI